LLNQQRSFYISSASFYLNAKNKRKTDEKMLNRYVLDISYYDKYLIKKYFFLLLLSINVDKLLLDIGEDRISMSQYTEKMIILKFTLEIFPALMKKIRLFYRTLMFV